MLGKLKALGIHDAVPHQAELPYVSQQRLREGVELVQREQADLLVVVKVPSLFGVKDITALEAAALHQLLPLLGELGRDDQALPVEAAQRRQVTQAVEADEFNIDALGGVQTVEAAQVGKLGDVLQPQALDAQLRQRRQLQRIADLELVQERALECREVVEHRTFIDLDAERPGVQPPQRPDPIERA